MSEERMGDQNNKTEDRHAARGQERDTFREADRERIDWNNVAARLERLRPLRDRFAVELAAEQVANAQNASPLHALSAEQLDAHIESMANVLVRERVEQLERRIEQLELGHAAALGKLADLRAAQSADPTGAHPYRSPVVSATAKPRDRVYVPADHPDYPYAAAPGRPITASDSAERVEGRPGAWRRVYGALKRHSNEWLALSLLGASGFLYWLAGSTVAGVTCAAMCLIPAGLLVEATVDAARSKS
jgi:hypothetical protein